MDERDVQTFLEALFDIKADTLTIIRLLEDDDGKEAEQDDD
jgi:hypothetical protein